jgi:hypothetical protein
MPRASLLCTQSFGRKFAPRVVLQDRLRSVQHRPVEDTHSISRLKNLVSVGMHETSVKLQGDDLQVEVTSEIGLIQNLASGA